MDETYEFGVDTGFGGAGSKTGFEGTGFLLSRVVPSSEGAELPEDEDEDELSLLSDSLSDSELPVSMSGSEEVSESDSELESVGIICCGIGFRGAMGRCTEECVCSDMFAVWDLARFRGRLSK